MLSEATLGQGRALSTEVQPAPSGTLFHRTLGRDPTAESREVGSHCPPPVIWKPLRSPHFQGLLSLPGAFPATLNHGPQGTTTDAQVQPCHLGHGGQGRGEAGICGLGRSQEYPFPPLPVTRTVPQALPSSAGKRLSAVPRSSGNNATPSQLEGPSTPLSPQSGVPEPLPLFLVLKVLRGP